MKNSEKNIDNDKKLLETNMLYSEIHQYVSDCDFHRNLFDYGVYAPHRLGVPADFLSGKRVLDAGCGGRGSFLRPLYELGAREIVAVDLSAKNVELARLANQDIARHITFRSMNLLENDFPDGCFHHINCNGVVHHVSDPGTAVAGLVRSLAPGGTIFLSVYGKGGLVSHTISMARFFARLIPFRLAAPVIRKIFDSWAARDILDYIYVPYLYRYTEDEAKRLLTAQGVTDVRRLPPQFLPAKARRIDRYLRSAHVDHNTWLGRFLFGQGWIVLFARKE
jgi:2-polyprenyl-3-methyl-5-hydroxy-6-metoxy-1,4-benzoquinol methylase